MSKKTDQTLNIPMETLLQNVSLKTNDLKLKGSQLKGLTMFYKTIALVMCLSTSTLAFSASAGAGSGGGGYQYRDTSYKHLKQAKENLLLSLSVTTNEELQQFSSTLSSGEPLDRNKLIKIIREIKNAPLENRTNHVDGFEQPKDMHYSIEGQYIMGLQPLYESINKEELTDKERSVLKRKILHEATHLFNIGTEENKDDESYELSKQLTEFLNVQAPICGLKGSVEERIKNCTENNQRYVNSAAPEWVRNFYGTLVYLAIKQTHLYIYENKENNFLISLQDVKKNLNPEEYCKKMDTFDGSVSWKVASLEEIKKVNPKNKIYSANDILIGKNKVFRIKNGYFLDKSYISEVTKEDKDYDLRAMCVGTRN